MAQGESASSPPRPKRVGVIFPRRCPDRVPTMPPLDRAPQEHFRNMFNRPDPLSQGPETQFPSGASPSESTSPSSKKRVGVIFPRRCPDRVPKMTPLGRAAQGHSETCSNVPIRHHGAPKPNFQPARAPARDPTRAPKTSRGHLSPKMPQLSPENAPMGQSSSQAFQNMFRHPNLTSYHPQTPSLVLSSMRG